MDLNPLAHIQIDQPPTFFTVDVAPREPHAAVCTDAQLILFYIPDSTASAPPQLYVCHLHDPGADYFPGQSRKFIMKQGHYSLSFLLSFKILAPCPAPLPSPLSILYFPTSGGEDTNEEIRRFSFSLLSSEVKHNSPLISLLSLQFLLSSTIVCRFSSP